jgi:hypothetical protein
MPSDTTGGGGAPSGGGNSDNGGGEEYELPEQLLKLIELITMHNPYTDGDPKSMDFLVYPPTTEAKKFSQFRIEIEAGYPTDWSFKGQPQKINKMLRIQYRAKAKVRDGYGTSRGDQDDYWMSAFLLIGFEDGAG